MPKNLTLRLDDQQAETLEVLARAENESLSDAVRDAIDARIEHRNDKAFMERVRERRARARAV